jgi:hypothetical protein
MEQHPIPQDVTGFQFKLIGSMTVKQFAYVAVGVIIAVVIYYLPINSPLNFLIKFILIPFIGGSGFAVAFLPIDGRPVDVMASNFFKSLFSPNQYIYHKEEAHFSFATIALHPQQTKQNQAATKQTFQSTQQNKQKQLQALLQQGSGHTNKALDEREANFLSVFSLPQQGINPQQATPPEKQKETVETLAKKEVILTQQLSLAKQEETQPHTPSDTESLHKKMQMFEQQLQKIHTQKQQLETDITILKNQLSEQAKQPTPQPIVQTQQQPEEGTSQQTPTLVSPPQKQIRIRSLPKKQDLPSIPETPNIIVGIVKDPRKNVLPNMLVEIKDKDGNPVRAFKTNLLGQFASATPLTPGNYSLSIEDPKKQQMFDSVAIIVNNEIIQPIEIISHDAREQLRKDLFS